MKIHRTPTLTSQSRISAVHRAPTFLTRAVVGAVVAACLLTTSRAQNAAAPAWPLSSPQLSTIPTGPLGDAIRFGHKVVTQTQTVAKEYVGNGLNCTSCHLSGGTAGNAAPWVGIWGVFPEYRSRNARVDTLQDRINDCFLRSMNGKALPQDSSEMLGILSYMQWLSEGVPTGVSVQGRGFLEIELPAASRIDVQNGQRLYQLQCSSCHGMDGQGRTEGSEYLYPALWGPKSFNIGAGMARLGTAAGFIKAKMPLHTKNHMSDRDAIDIAAYITRQPRPDYIPKALDWPKGGKPADAPY